MKQFIPSGQQQVYTCPMHPEIISNKPGTCPKCGMELVEDQRSKIKDQKEHSMTGSIDHTEHHRMMAQDFKKRFFASLPLVLLVLILSPKIQEWFGFSFDLPAGRQVFLFILGSIIVFYGGLPFFKAAREELKSRNYGMMTLVSLAVSAGYFFSVAATFLFPGESFYWEISTLVLAFLFGHWLEMRAVLGTGGALKELAKLIPPSAHKIIRAEVGNKNFRVPHSQTARHANSENFVPSSRLMDVSTEKLIKGDFVLVKPGEKMPIDGVVVEGESSVNEAMVTGESKPVAKKKGDTVIGGTLNNDGSLTIQVTKTGKETAISQIMDLIKQAQETKPSVQKLADRAANLLTLTAIVVGSGTFVYWMFINPSGAVFAATLAITVVVITCPHALGLAIPTVTTITSSLAAKNGILIRDMKGLEIARRVDCVIFDKTGTLTKGEFGVVDIALAGPAARSSKGAPASLALEAANADALLWTPPLASPAAGSSRLLSLAASVEVHSQHSIAKGIVNEAKKRKIKIPEAKNFKSYPGKGAEAVVEGKRVVVGNDSLMREFKVQSSKFKVGERNTGTEVFVAVDKKLAGAIVLSDMVREESKEAIKKLHEMGIKTAMLTGDKKEVGEDVGKKLGIDTVFSEVLPEDKVKKIKELQGRKIGNWKLPFGPELRVEGEIGNSRQGRVVAMVGDGVNDAPSLTQAHVGIAIGAGTDVAVESAEIVLVKNNPMDVIKIITLSKKTDVKMKQNLAWAAGYNILAIPAAAGLFYQSLGILLRPEWAALLMSASSIIVVLNALLLRRTKLN